MSNENNPTTSGGVGFLGLLTILFIGLKLGNVINWSWFWVLSPMIFSAGLGLLLVIIVLFVALRK